VVAGFGLKNNLRRREMKSLLLMVLMLFTFAAPFAFAGDDATDSLNLTVKVGDLTLDIDGDYTWKTLVEEPGLKFGTEAYKTARAECMAWDSLWADYKKAKAEEDYAKAEEFAPYSVLKGWSAWHQGCQRIGDIQEVEGRGNIYVYSEDAPKEELEAAIVDFRRAIRWGNVEKTTTDLVGMDNPEHGAEALLKQAKRSLGVAETMLAKKTGKDEKPVKESSAKK
jgi:hypothetical protein